MKLNDVVEHFLMDAEVKSRTRRTLISYRQRLGVLVQVLLQVCGVSELEQVNVMHLRQCVQHLLSPDFQTHEGRKRRGDTLSVTTVRGYVRVFKAFFHWCYLEDLIDYNPASRLAPPKPPVNVRPTFTSEHIEKMLAACDTSTSEGFRDYVMLLVLFDTGMRIAEICNLHVEDVHDTYIKVFGKGRKEREIGIHPEVSKLLWKYIHKHRHPKDPNETRLFLGRRRPLYPGGLQEVLKRIQHDSGLDGIKVTAHVFRHTFAKMYLEQGGEVFKLSREMGHSDVQVTKIYLEDFNSGEARKEHTAFSPIARINLKKNFRTRKKQE